MRRSILAATLTVAGIWILSAAYGQESNQLPKLADEQLRVIEQQLQQSQWASARQLAQSLAEDLVERSGGTLGDNRAYADRLDDAVVGPRYLVETVVLGRAAAFRAIAEAAMERRDEARWHWYLAQNLLGNVRSIELQRYRKSAEFLQRHYLADGHAQYAGMPDVVDPIRPEEVYGPKFAEPVRTRVVYPYLPQDLRARDRFSHVVFVQITIDTSGQIIQPVVVDGGFYPGLTSRAFDALREWRYRPATLDGKPVPFRFVVPIAFADDRAVLPLAEWGTPAPSLGVIPTGYTLNKLTGFSADLKSGAVYVVDEADSRILRIEPRGGATLLAGTGTSGFNGEDVSAREAQLNHPSAVSYDPRTGELFVADTRNYRIRSISPKDARLRTVAGVGIREVPRRIPYESHTPEALAVGHFSGDGGPATEAELNLPSGVCADPIGILFIADSGNHRIRAVNRGTSPVILMGVEIGPGEIRSVAGTGAAGFSGDGGKAWQAQLAFPTKLKLDAAGNLFVVDSFNQRIRRIDRQSGIIRTVVHGSLAGVDTRNAAVSWSTSVVGIGIAANQDIFYADRFDHTVHRLTRGGEDRVIYTSLPREGDFTDLELGAQGEIYLGEVRRMDVLHLNADSVMTYLDGATRPLPNRAGVNISSANRAE